MGGHDRGGDGLAPAIVGQTNDDDILDQARGADGGFDFGGEDVFAAADDFGAVAALDVEGVLMIEVAEVVDCEGLGGEVAAHQRSGLNLQGNIGRGDDLGVGQDLTAACVSGEKVGGFERGDLASGFGHAVGGGDREA
ncbi:MAG: hypothetical protein RLZZ511_1238 [Cyanobacteriota bacterium]